MSWFKWTGNGKAGTCDGGEGWTSFTQKQNEKIQQAEKGGKTKVSVGTWGLDLEACIMTTKRRNGDKVQRAIGKTSEETEIPRPAPRKRTARSTSPARRKKQKRSMSPVKKITLPDDETQVMTFGARKLNKKTIAVISSLLEECPRITRIPLASAANRMLSHVREWLIALGRRPAESGMKIQLKNQMDLDDDTELNIGKKFKLNCGDAQKLKNAAKITVVSGGLSDGPETTILPPKHVLTPLEHVESKQVMVSGPVYITFDNQYRSKSQTNTVLACSIPGINFEYSQEDLGYFCTTEGTKRKHLNEKIVTKTMKEVWSHALTVMAGEGVKYPVLCAIGCGEFKGKFPNVPKLWASTLFDVLAANPGFGFDCVLVSLPTFGEDNFSIFSSSFNSKDEAHLPCPVVMVEDYSMVTLADELASSGHASSLLNPSDVEAVRKGYIGMYWDGGHIALEELLALQTTLLLHHRGLNKALWSSPATEIDVKI
eukprot:TRINITY_DN1288_c3_g1_i1.p1 TRINITY_DN1288_c3_g1~~TRINITY_DN1288_c3_g1_i1.p1  ORF type:complete len:485 (+),score=71.15 TRINITY_DN1288_c3_g1_i1:59-1513(+)